MRRGARAGWLALAASLLLHAAIIGGFHEWTPPSPVPIAVPAIEARLVAVMPEPAPVIPAPPSSSPVSPVTAVAPAPAPAAEPSAAVVDSAEAVAVVEAEPQSGAAQPEPVVAEPASGPHNVVAPAETTAVPFALPARIDMRFKVHYGVASGEQTLVWVSDGVQYTVTSVATATGLAGVFYRGQLVQTSRGRVNAQGLQPEEFWDQRGNRRSSTRIEQAGDGTRLVLNPAQGAPRHLAHAGGVQDLLSLMFQLALAAPLEGQATYAVFNGKKLREYTFEPRGEVELETALGTLNTLHVARVADAAGRFEAWLAVERNYLPVRVLRGDDAGNVVELRVLSIAP